MTTFTLPSRACVIGILMVTLPISGCSTRLQAPPEHLKVNQDVKISFKSSDDVTRECTEILVGLLGQKKKSFDACAIKASVEADPIVILPNPCEFEGPYASLLCHELAHVNQMEFKEAVNHTGWKIETVKQWDKSRPVLLAESKIKVDNKIIQADFKIIKATTEVVETEITQAKVVETKPTEVKIIETEPADTKTAETEIKTRKVIDVLPKDVPTLRIEVAEALVSDIPALRTKVKDPLPGDVPVLRSKVTEVLPSDIPALRKVKLTLSEPTDIKLP